MAEKKRKREKGKGKEERLREEKEEKQCRDKISKDVVARGLVAYTQSTCLEALLLLVS